MRDEIPWTEELMRANRRFRILVVSVLIVGIGGFWVWAAWHSGHHASLEAASARETAAIGARQRAMHDHLGVASQPVTRSIARAFGLDEARGALVGDVASGTPAERAGIRRGDVILGLDGWPVRDSSDLRHRIAEVAAGGSVSLDVLRGDRLREITVALETSPTGGGGAEAPTVGGDSPPGISVAALTSDTARELALSPDLRGVVVSAVEAGTAWSEAGLGRGDVIEEVDRMVVADAAAFEEAVRRADGEPVLLLVNHGGTTTFVVVDLG